MSITPPNDPFSSPPLAGSKSDQQWVQRNATLFGANEAWGSFKFLLLFVVLVFVVLPIAFVFLGSLGMLVVLGLVVAMLLVLGVRAQRRRRARVPRW
jgi:Flp pilus assembly protein TadB